MEADERVLLQFPLRGVQLAEAQSSFDDLIDVDLSRGAVVCRAGDFFCDGNGDVSGLNCGAAQPDDEGKALFCHWIFRSERVRAVLSAGGRRRVPGDSARRW